MLVQHTSYIPLRPTCTPQIDGVRKLALSIGLGDIACFDLNYTRTHYASRRRFSAHASIKQLVDSKQSGSCHANWMFCGMNGAAIKQTMFAHQIVDLE